MKNLFLLLTLTGILYSQNLNVINSLANKTILLSKDKEPQFVIKYKKEGFGTSLIKGVETFYMNFSNVNREDYKNLKITAKLLNKTKTIDLDSLLGEESVDLYFTFKNISLLKNTQNLTVKFIVEDKGNSWEFAKELNFNKSSMNIKLIGKDLQEKSLSVNGKTYLFNSKNTLVVPTFSNSNYQLTIQGKSDEKFFIKIDDNFILNSLGEKSKDNTILDYNVVKIKRKDKAIYKITFSLPEIISLKGKTTKVSLKKYNPSLPNNGLNVVVDSSNLKAFYKDGFLVLEELRRGDSFSKVEVYSENSFLYEFFVKASSLSSNETRTGREKDGLYLLIEDSNYRYSLDSEQVGKITVNSVVKLIEKRDEFLRVSYKNKEVWIKNNNIVKILGDNTFYVQGKTVLKTPIYVNSFDNPITTIDKDSFIDGEMDKNGKIVYKNKKWFTHGKFTDITFKMLIKPNFTIRDSVEGEKLSITDRFMECEGSFYRDDWMRISKLNGVSFNGFIHRSGVYIKDDK